MGCGPTGVSQARPPPRAARLALPTRLLRNPLAETDTPFPLAGPGTLEFGADSVWNQADM